MGIEGRRLVEKRAEERWKANKNYVRGSVAILICRHSC
jgi:hypothetical protein